MVRVPSIVGNERIKDLVHFGAPSLISPSSA
jgi:hypothetical protein